uniref:BPTI/Kunitz inhibitor domain-containing protein n=1 Tax=Glossina morsitans morsitans TaxID=37546 RepID=A0A1B0FQ66_GLOMM
MRLLAVLVLSAIAVVCSGKKPPEFCKFTHAANTDDPSICDGGGQSLWSYVLEENSCVEFYYYGCYGNNNRFFTKSQCEYICKKLCNFQHSANSEDPSFCDGGGQNLWSYVPQANSCVEFYYYGCYGNENRFFTKAQCEETCKKKPGFRKKFCGPLSIQQSCTSLMYHKQIVKMVM